MRKIPVLVGGGGEQKTLRLVARHADIWHWFSSGAEFARKKQILADHFAAIGRDRNRPAGARRHHFSPPR